MSKYKHRVEEERKKEESLNQTRLEEPVAHARAGSLTGATKHSSNASFYKQLRDEYVNCVQGGGNKEKGKGRGMTLRPPKSTKNRVTGLKQPSPVVSKNTHQF